MKHRLSAVSVGALVALFGLMGCFRKPKGFGADTELYVVADSTNWVALEPTLREVFERVLRTPQEERVFAVYWVSPEKFGQFSSRKNLVIAGVLDSEGEIDRQIEGMLAPDVRARVEAGEAFVFPKEAPWAEGQLLLVLAGPTLEQLRLNLLQNKALVYNLLYEHLLAQTKESMFERLEQTDIEQQLLEKYGWMVRVQHDYFINTERPQDRFVFLRRSLPGRERWLFVHWVEGGNPNQITCEWIINTRNKLTRKFYQGDYVDEKNTRAEEVEFLGRRALKLEGLWANEEKVAGGPFRNYTFYDEATGRIYMIDLAVFFPGGEKEPFLRQLDIIAHTFKTAEEVEAQTQGTEEVD